jgi:hypothetical protein
MGLPEDVRLLASGLGDEAFRLGAAVLHPLLTQAIDQGLYPRGREPGEGAGVRATHGCNL